MTAQTLIDEYKAKTEPDSVSPVLTANMAQAVLNECANLRFIAVSSSPMLISEDDTAMTTVSGLTMFASTNGFTVDAATGSVENTGLPIVAPTGSLSYQPTRTGGGAANVLYIISESSSDKVNWTKNLNSLRRIEIPSDGETFKTSVSFADTWGTGDSLRFKFYTEGGGDITFTPAVKNLEGVDVSGYSFAWELGG